MEEREYQGAIYRRSGPGQPWQRVGPAQGGGRIIPASPSTARKADAEAEKAAAEAQYARPREAAELAKARADADKAASEAAATAKASAAAPEPASPQVREARNELATDSIIDKLALARRQIGDGWATGNVAGTHAFQSIPFVGQNSSSLAATLGGIKGAIISDMIKNMRAQAQETGSKGTGLGQLTEREADRLAAAVAALDQVQRPEELLAALAAVEKHYRNANALLNGEDPRDPEVAKRYGIVFARPGGGNPQDDSNPAGTATIGGPGVGSPPPSAPPSGDGGQAVLSADGKIVPDPALAGTNAKVAAMVREGATADEVRAYLNRVQPGLGDKTHGIEDSVNFYAQHPDVAPNVDVETMWQPASGINRALGNAALWEDPLFGFSPGTALVGMGDMASFGTLDNFSDNPDRMRALMSGVAQKNPGSMLTGQIAGGVLSGLGLENLGARAGLGALGRARLSEGLVGAGYGAGSADDPDDSRIMGGAAGGLFGLAGGAVGRGAARTAGRAVSGVTDASRRLLADRNVPMTVGQLLGGAAKTTEDRLAGYPLIGDRINAMRGEGRTAFNRAVFDEGLAPVGGSTNGVIGEQGVDLLRAARGSAYDNALDGVTVSADAPFIGDMQSVIQSGQQLPQSMRGNIDDTLRLRVGDSFDDAGNLSGHDFQQSLRGLRRDAKSMEPLPYGYDFGNITRDAEGALEGLIERQSPQTLPLYRAANEVNRNVEVIRDAVNAARNGARSNEIGEFMPSQIIDAAARNAKRFGNTAGTTDQPFFALSRAGQEVLPSRIADSGTAGRLLIPSLLLGGGGVSGYANADEGEGLSGTGSGLGLGLLATAALAGPFASKSARNVIARALLAERNPAVQKIGQEIIDRNRIAGLLAAPGLALEGQ